MEDLTDSDDEQAFIKWKCIGSRSNLSMNFYIVKAFHRQRHEVCSSSRNRMLHFIVMRIGAYRLLHIHFLECIVSCLHTPSFNSTVIQLAEKGESPQKWLSL